MKAGAVIAALLVCTISDAAAVDSDSAVQADRLIAAAKQASGGPAWDRAVLWHEQGQVHAGGLSGQYEAWASMASLHNTQRFELGPVSGSNGWDGARAWSTDSSGEVRIETSGESVAQAIQDAYRSVYAFFLPLAIDADRTFEGERVADGASYEVIRITPANAEPFRVGMLAPVGGGRLIQLLISPEGEQPTYTAGQTHKATVFRIHPEIGGIVGVIARLIGLQPKDVMVWVLEGEDPAVLRIVGQLGGYGPVVNSDLEGISFGK